MGRRKKAVEEALQPPAPRNYQIPGCSVLVSNNEDDSIAIEDLLGIVFGLASANPGARVEFGIRVLSDG